jgi:hypothetical protein
MKNQDLQIWMKSLSPATRRVILVGVFGYLGALVVCITQYLIWSLMGWGAANFLPGWVRVAIYVAAGCIGVCSFYFFLAYSARVEKKVRWGMALLAALFGVFFVAGALGHSLPQLSTLVFSAPMEKELQIYSSELSTRSHGKRVCRTHVTFGPITQFRGGMCGLYMGEGDTYTFQGHGHAWAVRLHSYER